MRLVFLLIPLAMAAAKPASAQLQAPNGDGVAMGQVHLTVRDVDGSQRFFALLGGKPVVNGSLRMVEFPGLYVVLARGEPGGGTVGSSINHFGFLVRNMKDWLEKWQAAGVRMEPMNRATQVYLLAPGDVRIEILEEPTLDTPIAGHHIHFATADIPATQAWYAKTFGAVPGKRAQFVAADLPGINLTFSASNGTVAPTRGRALDAVGFEVRDLRRFVARLESAGVRMDQAPHGIARTTVTEASFTDPWGTTIRLTQGLAPPARR